MLLIAQGVCESGFRYGLRRPPVTLKNFLKHKLLSNLQKSLDNVGSIFEHALYLKNFRYFVTLTN